MLLLGLFLISFASAAEWDHVKFYNEDSKTLTITNALGMGRTLLRIQLLSDQHNKIEAKDDAQIALLKIHEFLIKKQRLLLKLNLLRKPEHWDIKTIYLLLKMANGSMNYLLSQ